MRKSTCRAVPERITTRGNNRAMVPFSQRSVGQLSVLNIYTHVDSCLHISTCPTTYVHVCVRNVHPANAPSNENRATHKLFLLPAKQLIAKRIRVTHINNTNMLILISTVESPSDAAVERGWEALSQAEWWEAQSWLTANRNTETDGLRRFLVSQRC